MLKHALLHLPYDPMAYPVGEDEVEVVLRAARGDLKSVSLLYVDRSRLACSPEKPASVESGATPCSTMVWSDEAQYGRFCTLR